MIIYPLLKLAARELRHSGTRLLLFISCVVIGISGLTALTVFRNSLTEAINLQAKELLGADLVVTARQRPKPEMLADLQNLPGILSQSRYTTTVAFFPKNSESRLVQLRAADHLFPLYGNLETEPRNCWDEIRAGRGVLVDQTLLHKHQLAIGDTITIGATDFEIKGSLLRVPGEILGFGIIAPRVYLSLDALDRTGLTGFGSQVRYRFNYKIPSEVDPAVFFAKAYPILQKHRLESDSALQRKDSIGKTINNVHSLLSLAALASLLLGGIGIALSAAVYFRSRAQSIAVLRLIGLTPSELWFVLLAQFTLIGVVSSVLGVSAGAALSYLFPSYFSTFLPIQLNIELEIFSLLRPLLFGIITTVSFSLPAIYQAAATIPAQVLETFTNRQRLPLKVYILTAIIIFLFLLGSALWETNSLPRSLSFIAAASLAILIVITISRILTQLAKYAANHFKTFSLRYGIRALFRPDNRATAVIAVIGLGVAVLWCLMTVKHSLVTDIDTLDESEQFNLIFFDIQPEQLKSVESLLPRHESTPLISMRLYDIAGKRVADLLEETSTRIPRWALKREYRSSYRLDSLPGEELIAGQWPPSSVPPDLIPISIERGIAEDLGVKLHDQLTFDIQGLLVRTEIVAIRKVDWKKLRMNFFFIFPPSALEEAPKTFASATRVEAPEESAILQREISKLHPNVSAIDLRLTLESVKEMISQLQAAAHFIAAFFVACATLILSSALIQSSSERLREANLLRVLGADKATVVLTTIVEYLTLGVIGCFTALTISLITSYLIVRYQLEVGFAIPLKEISLAFLGTVTGIIAIGFVLGGTVYRTNPKELLQEGAN